MKDERIPDSEIDERLRRGFSGDMPPDVESMLGATVRAFRRRSMGAAGDALQSSWTFWRAAAALASLLLTILGATLHSGRGGSLFADSIELWHRQARLVRIVQRAEVMEARVEPEGLIRWRGGAVSIEPRSRSLEELAPQLEPRALARRLEGTWRRKLNGAYQVSPRGTGPGIEITVDPETDLPVRITDEQRGYAARLVWVLRPAESVLTFRSDTPKRR